MKRRGVHVAGAKSTRDTGSRSEWEEKQVLPPRGGSTARLARRLSDLMEKEPHSGNLSSAGGTSEEPERQGHDMVFDPARGDDLASLF